MLEEVIEGLEKDKNRCRANLFMIGWDPNSLKGMAPYFSMSMVVCSSVKKAIFLPHWKLNTTCCLPNGSLVSRSLKPVLPCKMYRDGASDPDSTISDSASGFSMSLHEKFAPYIGINWERKLGETADMSRAGDGHVSNLSLLGGVRMWF